MKKSSQIALLTALLIACFLCGCRKKIEDTIDDASIENSVYSNEFFGFTLQIPDNWYTQNKEARQMLMDAGSEALTGDDKNLKAAMDASKAKAGNLLSVFRHPLGTPVAFNANLICIAEQIEQFPGIKTANDYFYHVRQLAQKGQMEITFADKSYPETLGGIEFNILEDQISLGEMVIKQKHYVAIMKGYALDFIVTFETQEDLESLQQMLQTLSFQE